VKTIVSSVGREFKLIFRNGISLYMAIAPALLAILFIVIFGALENTRITLAVDSSVDEASVTLLEQVADVERFEDLDQLKARVLNLDNIAGVTMDGGTPRVLVEGNEGKDFPVYMQTLVSMALSGVDVGMFGKSAQSEDNIAMNVTMISILLMSLFIGGATVGLSIVSERETGVIRAVAVSPLRLSGYVLTKLIPALILCTAGMTAATLIMGKSYGLPGFLILTLFSVFTMGLMIFAIGTFAQNQIAAIGVLKLILPLSLVLPVSAMFVPEHLHFLYYALPMYWQYVAIDAINSKAEFWLPCIITLLVSIPWFGAIVYLFSGKVKMKYSR